MSNDPFFEPEIHSDLDRMRHSTAHLLAHAVANLYPGARFGIGPTIEDGFYYDIDIEKKLTPEDLSTIQKEMIRLKNQKQSFIREEHSISEAKALFESLGQTFKIDILNTLEANGETKVTTYKEGNFIDLCRGPHVANTIDIGAFKLQSVAGAFWRGQEGNPQLQRIYGTAFFKDTELKEHLSLIEEAKRRDHRKLGKELDLFSFHPNAPASPFFHPRGTILYNGLVQLMRKAYGPFKYDEVITPMILDVDLWKTSGHYEHYKDAMYFTDVDGRDFAVKPMNCPAHTFIYSAQRRSYKELPLRLADFGRLHRHERSGVTAGLTRVRTFCQDDGHIFCAVHQIESEIHGLIQLILSTYKLFGFTDVRICLSTRPESRVGSEELWDQSETALENVLKSTGKAYFINKGDGAFYGPKIDFQVLDALKRKHQLGTIQLDFNLPERFNLEYVTADNGRDRPVMIHRAVLGSIERFLGILIEHTAGVFPLWLAPTQVKLIPINDAHVNYVNDFAEKLRGLGMRVDVDARNESMGMKVRESQTAKIPYTLAAGDRELEGTSFSVRLYGEKESKVMSQADLLQILGENSKVPTLSQEMIQP